MEGYRSDDDLRDYLKLLKAAGNLTLAGEVLDHYLQEQMVLEFALEQRRFSLLLSNIARVLHTSNNLSKPPFDADLAVKLSSLRLLFSI